MMKYEYKFLEFSRSEFEKHEIAVNELAKEGWQLFDHNYMSMSYLYFLRRELWRKQEYEKI